MTSAAPGGDPGPTAARILLGSRLRQAREAAGVPPAAAAREIRASASKMSRLELGRVGFKRHDVADLLTLYGVTGEERSRLLELADGANEAGWWHTYAEVLPSWFEAFVGLEAAASVIRTYEVQFVPGLLQTPGYAAAITAAGDPTAGSPAAPGDLGEGRVHVRLQRQRLLTRPDPPHVWAVIDEGALRRPIGGREIMREQLEHLLEVAKLPSVTLQVMPFRYGAHAAEGGTFIFLRFAEPDLPDVVYLESLAGATYLDDQRSVDIYNQAADRLAVDAAGPAASAEIITDILHQT